MTVKIEWDGREFWVKVGHRKAKDKIATKNSADMIKTLKDMGVRDWKFSFSAKNQVKKEKK